MSQAPTLRPLSVGEILDTGIKLLTRNLGTLLTISAVVIVPIYLLTFGLNLVVVRTMEDLTRFTTDFDASDLFPLLGAVALTVVITALAFLIVNAGSLKAVADIYLGHAPDWRASLTMAISKLWTLIANGLLEALAIGATFAVPVFLIALAVSTGDDAVGALSALAALFMFLAGVVLVAMLVVYWSVAVPAIMVERAGPAQALGRSWRLVRGRFWPVAGVLILVAMIRWVLSLATGIVSQLVVFARPDDLILATVASTLQSILTDVVLLPFAAAIIAVLYFDLRVRKEGFDLELLAQSLSAPYTPWAPPPTYPAPAPTDQSPWSPPPGGPTPPFGQTPPPPPGVGRPAPPQPSPGIRPPLPSQPQPGPPPAPPPDPESPWNQPPPPPGSGA